MMNKWLLLFALAGFLMGAFRPEAAAQVMQLTDGTYAYKAVAYFTNGTAVTW